MNTWPEIQNSVWGPVLPLETPVQHLCLTYLWASVGLLCGWPRRNWNNFYTRLVQVRKMGLVTWPFQGASFCNCVGSWWCGCSPFFIGFLSWRHHWWAEVSCCYWRRLSFLWCKLCSRAHLTKVVSFTTINFSKCLGAHLKNPDVNRIFLFSSQNAAFLGSSLLLIFCRKGKLFRPLLQILEANSCHPWY